MWSSSVIQSSKWNTTELISNGGLFQPHLKYTLTFFHTFTSRSRSFITTLFHSSVHFFPILVKGLYQRESYSLHVMQLIRIQTTEEYFYFPHLVVWGRNCACELLIAPSIDWLFAACLEYLIFSSIDSSQVRKQYDEYCLSIMQTITYAHDRTHFQCTTYINIWSIICPLDVDLREWNW